ncbi:hypothetical protein THAOC_22486 [Thalassiosira oceanica]|uniref:Uncharacterized protein n=1 Tax=Thalassiosira oceanica TaxID=159749 RepID=K0RY97_THAOC|nr:hypothetical protein THAOC_22486 [Thalassiosira oceanica]|eukprot:EJK57464.1 hypothetical protein THAOC_22486 [Thalassiosira oceanica]
MRLALLPRLNRIDMRKLISTLNLPTHLFIYGFPAKLRVRVSPRTLDKCRIHVEFCHSKGLTSKAGLQGEGVSSQTDRWQMIKYCSCGAMVARLTSNQKVASSSLA